MCLADTKCFLPIRAVLNRLSAYRNSLDYHVTGDTNQVQKHHLHNISYVAELILILHTESGVIYVQYCVIRIIILLKDRTTTRKKTMEKQDGETEVKDELVSILCRTLKLLLYCCLIIHVPEQKRKKYVNTKNWKKKKKYSHGRKILATLGV